MPVIFGNKYSKFPEAYQFIEAEIGFSISSSADFESIYVELINSNNKSQVIEFMRSKKGATGKILEEIF